jgi:hypothetical protein
MRGGFKLDIDMFFGVETLKFTKLAVEKKFYATFYDLNYGV